MPFDVGHDAAGTSVRAGTANKLRTAMGLVPPNAAPPRILRGESWNSWSSIGRFVSTEASATESENAANAERCLFIS